MEPNDAVVSLDTEDTATSKTPAPGTDERRDYDAKAAQKYRDKKRTKAEETFRLPGCKNESSRKDGLAILADRGISNVHVRETLYDLAGKAAHDHRIPVNDYLLRNGLHATLAALDSGELPAEAEDADVPGELISKHALRALWDFSLFSRPEITFERFLELRRVCKTDCYELGLLLGKDFHEVHKAWSEFFPRVNPDTLPRDYTQEQMKAWLDSQGEKKDFLLLASRNCYKSSFAIVWLVSAILCCPDLRCLLVSETTPLSKGFIRALRGYFEVQNLNQPTLFNQLFPECTIPAGEGSVLSFQSPMARLNLIQQTAQATSMDSSVAGQRADILLYDDPISNLTTGNEEMRQASVDKFDLVQKLREVGGITAVLGTPWATTDLYAALLKRNEEDSDKPLQFRIDPAWTVKPEAKNKALKDLCEEDVNLLFPSRLTWKFLQKERRANERFFRSQNLVEFLEDEDAALKLNFDEDVLRSCLVSPKELPAGETVFGVDIAYSANSKYADLTAIAVCSIHKNMLNESCLTVIDMLADRYRASELAVHLALLTKRHNPRTILLEKAVSYDLIQAEISRAGTRYGVYVPTYWIPVDNHKGAKFSRLKNLETFLMAGRLRFAAGEYVDALFHELTRQDGRKSSSGRKDDRADALSIVQKVFAPAISAPATDLEESRKIFAEQRQAAIRNANYSRIFGGEVPTPTAEPVPRNYFNFNFPIRRT